MTKPFDIPTWRSRVAAWWRQTAHDLPGTMQCLGVRTAYGLLTSSAWLPLLAAYGDNPGPAVAALVGVLSGVGTNLLSNLVQKGYDEAAAAKIEREIAERPHLRAEHQQLLAGLGVLATAQEALGADWPAFEAQLRSDLARLGGELHLDSGGGTIVVGDVSVQYGDFVGRDKREHHYHLAPPAPDLTPLREAYLRHIADRCERLPLRGVDVQAGDATAHAERPCLAHVYVDLGTTTQMGKEEFENSPFA